MAQALVTGHSKTLGVVSFDTTLHVPASTLLGIEQAAHDVGYAVSIASLQSLNRASMLGAVQKLQSQGVEHAKGASLAVDRGSATCRGFSAALGGPPWAGDRQ